MRNSSQNFGLLSYHGASIVSLAERNLDSAPSTPGVAWVGLTAVDLISGFDQGAQELVAVRSVQSPYRADTFVYGTAQNRSRRDNLLNSTRSQAYWARPGPSAQGNYDRRHDTWSSADIQTLIDSMKVTHTNTYNWPLEYPHDYSGLVSFLQATAASNAANCVDGGQIRVWVTLVAPPDPATYNRVLGDPCSRPEDTGRGEASYFHEGIGSNADPDYCGQFVDPAGGWSALLGTLAAEFPNLVAVGFDDYSLFIPHEDGTTEPPLGFNEPFLATFESNIQSRAPWVSFVPTFYFETIASDQALTKDYGKLLDTVLFYFRNESNPATGVGGQCSTTGTSSGCDPGPDVTCNGVVESPLAASNCCLANTCSESTVPNAPDEFCAMNSFLEAGRRLQIGAYFSGHSCCGDPSPRYDYSLFRMAINNPWMNIGGTTVYTMDIPGTGDPADPAVTCTSASILTNKYCTVAALYGGASGTSPDVNTVENLDLSRAACFAPPTAAGRPFGYVVNASGNENIVYRGNDGSIYELWRDGSAAGSTNLTSAAGVSVTALSDPTAFISPVDGSQNVVYRASDGHLHNLSFSTGAVLDQDITSAINPSGGKFINPQGNVFGYSVPSLKENEIIYRGTDNHIYEVYWSTSWPPSWTDLSATAGLTVAAASDPFGYSFDALNKQNAIFVGADGHIRELYWWTGAVGVTDLTANAKASNAVGNPVAYVANSYGVQNVFYRDSAGHARELYWSTGAVGAADISGASVGTVDDPWGYFRPDDATNHLIYRDSSNHFHESSWTTGSVINNDLTRLGENYPSTESLGVGQPTGYYDAFDKTQHVIYRSSDNHIHDLSWGK